MATLYYSKACSNCMDFLKKLREESMLKLFDEYFCIDNRNPKTFPQWLHSVPTIVVPEADQPLVGDDAFAWLTYKLNQKYQINELGTLNQNGGDYVDLTKDPTEINLDSDQYISINNIDKPIRPQDTQKFMQAESMDVQKRMEQLQQERSTFMSQQKGATPQQPNFQSR